ncbi:hypothetical protein AB6A40_006459 [Gnathostoma spinigerum]|uniref:V-SNARE coiled-coil homology domain-containing protein n=1 Tax=Gnathostoma spinigerum TaxID=75299 RepID=A0ABD6EJL9_9BILA
MQKKITLVGDFVTDTNASPSLWIGTSKGSCIVFNLLLPIDRMTSTVVVAPSGSALRTKGHLLYYAFLDQSFCIITAASESYKVAIYPKDIDMSKTTSVPTCSSEKTIQNKVITKCSLSPTYSNASDYAKEDDFCQLVTVVSEEEIRTLTLPSYCQVFFHHPDIPLVMARSSHIRGHPILMALNAAGHIAVFSLPTVRPLFSSPLCGFSVDIGDPICRKTSFSEHGLGIYSITPSEVQKFTVCSELAAQVNDCLGDIYVPTEMPEPPKTSFLKGVSSLFAAQKDDVDLDNIFADKGLTNSSQANPMRSMVKVIPGPSANMEQAQARGVSAGQAAQMAIQALSERGEKLSATVDATERLRDNAMNFSQKTGKLVEKYEKKKWYNL